MNGDWIWWRKNGEEVAEMEGIDWTTEICDTMVGGVGQEERNCVHIGFDLQAGGLRKWGLQFKPGNYKIIPGDRSGNYGNQ